MPIDFQNVDCFNRMKQMSDNSLNLIVTDPPYGINFKGQTSNTDWDNSNGFEDFMRRFLLECKRILTDSGTLWMFCGRTQIPLVFRLIEEVGLNNNLENWMTYCRMKGRGAKNKLKSQAEEILHITKGNNFYFNSFEYLRECVVPYIKDGKPRGWFIDQNTGERLRWSGVGNVTCFTSPFFKNKFEHQIHSTQKPVLLFAELIMLSSKEGDVVFDPFAGSCSCGVASVLTKRNFIGCELDEQMFSKAQKWLDNIDYDLAKEYVNKRVRGKQLNIFG